MTEESSLKHFRTEKPHLWVTDFKAFWNFLLTSSQLSCVCSFLYHLMTIADFILLKQTKMWHIALDYSVEKHVRHVLNCTFIYDYFCGLSSSLSCIIARIAKYWEREVTPFIKIWHCLNKYLFNSRHVLLNCTIPFLQCNFNLRLFHSNNVLTHLKIHTWMNFKMS
jgi:hypothetical protein